MTQTTETAYKYRWVILGVLWISYIVVFLNRLSVGPLAPFLKEEMSLSNAQVGMIMSAASLGFMLTLFPTGWVVDKIGARWPVAIGELIAGTSMLAMFFVPTYYWLLVLMLVTGMGAGFLMPANTQGVIIWFPQRERATALGLIQTSVNIGGIITATTLPALALALGWRYGFLLLGFVSIAIGIISIIFYKEPPAPASSSAVKPAPLGKDIPALELLKSREIWLVGLCGFCLGWAEMAATAQLVLYLTEALFFSVILAGGLLAMIQVAGAIGRPAGGLISDRLFGGRRKTVFLLMAGAAAITYLLLGLAGPYLSWAIYPVIFVMGLGGFGFAGVWIALISEFGGRYGAGKAAGMGTTVTMGGVVLGPIIFGYLVDIATYKLAWLSLALMAALCVILLLFVREDKRQI